VSIRPRPYRSAIGLRLVTKSGPRPESDSPSLAEYERLYAQSCQAAALLIRISGDLGRKIGKLRSSVCWDLQQLVLDGRSERHR